MRPGRTAGGRNAEAGITLVEVLVALVLCALVGAAGFAMLDQILRTQAHTEGRLDQLARIQRVLHLVATDFMQASGGSLSGAADSVSFRRQGGFAVRYAVEEAALVRHISDGAGEPARQVLLPDNAGVAWRFLAPDLGWIPEWPPAGPEAGRGEGAPEPPPSPNPAAVELILTLAEPGRAGSLRRIAVLPAEAAR